MKKFIEQAQYVHQTRINCETTLDEIKCSLVEFEDIPISHIKISYFDDHLILTPFISVIETDVEYEIRIKKEKEFEENTKKREYNEYLKLKDKFKHFEN